VKLEQGTGFATMPRGLSAEVDTERYESWAAMRGSWRRETRVQLEGGPFDTWAWHTSLPPDRFVAEDGQYRSLLQGNQAILDNEPITYVWSERADVRDR
jgi:hypothetical protein